MAIVLSFRTEFLTPNVLSGWWGVAISWKKSHFRTLCIHVADCIMYKLGGKIGALPRATPVFPSISALRSPPTLSTERCRVYKSREISTFQTATHRLRTKISLGLVTYVLGFSPREIHVVNALRSLLQRFSGQDRGLTCPRLYGPANRL